MADSGPLPKPQGRSRIKFWVTNSRTVSKKRYSYLELPKSNTTLVRLRQGLWCDFCPLGPRQRTPRFKNISLKGINPAPTSIVDLPTTSVEIQF